ncbi:HPP family protein [Saliphagus infecundisoli]|uniref:HPP family protein n=1 Tax=Saliphagus infecundisoli TaxID=1849069 RepID=A0ABD5Q8Z5_9EURY|nr:HPP family protein [Saliphagus infecundisoli]
MSGGRDWRILRILIEFVVLIVVALLSNNPLILLALAISGYELATNPTSPSNTTPNVLGGHFIALVTGLLIYHAIAPGLSALEPPSSMSLTGLRLLASGSAAMLATMVSMQMTELYHPPAYATAVALGLGLLISPMGVAAIVVGAIALILTEALLTQIGMNAADPAN